MRGRMGQVLLIVITGVILGVAIGGVPSRHKDPAIRVEAAETATTVTTAPTTTAPPAPASTQPAPVARPPKDVSVLVANASTVEGSAGRITTKLRAAGYKVLDPDPNLGRRDTSVVYFRDGFSAEATVLAEALGLPGGIVQPSPASGPTFRAAQANLYVIVGQELASRK